MTNSLSQLALILLPVGLLSVHEVIYTWLIRFSKFNFSSEIRWFSSFHSFLGRYFNLKLPE